MKKKVIIKTEKEILICDICGGEITHTPVYIEGKDYHPTCWNKYG